MNLTPVYGKLHSSGDSDQPAVLLVLLPELERPAQPNDFIVGVIRIDPEEHDCHIWDLLGSDVEGGAAAGRVQFDASGTFARTKARCEPADFGQFFARAAIDAPPQTVFPFDSSKPALDFEAMLVIDRDNGARGFVDVPLWAPGGFGIFFGVVLQDAEQEFQVFGVGVRFNTGDLLDAGDLLQFTVKATPTDAGGDHHNTGDPDCLIWDVVNGGSGVVNGSSPAVEGRNAAAFEALATKFKVSPRPGRGGKPPKRRK